jgi:hypothetical protein
MSLLALKFYHEGGFGGIRDKFDSIIPLAKWRMKQRVLWDTTENSDESK